MTLPGGLAIGVLGPLVVSRDGHPIVLTAGRLRSLLSVLALFAGEPVAVGRLAAALWDVDRPVDAKRSVQVYVARLRAVVGAGWIVSSTDGYALRLSPENVDATRFCGLVDAAGRDTDRVTERALLDQALALWRGDPFEDVQSTWLRESEAPRLVERYLSTIERRLRLTTTHGWAGHVPDFVVRGRDGIWLIDVCAPAGACAGWRTGRRTGRPVAEPVGRPETRRGRTLLPQRRHVPARGSGWWLASGRSMGFA